MSISHVLCRCFTSTLVISWTTKRRNLGSTERGFPLSWLRTLCESLSEAQTKHPNTNSSESKSFYHSFTEDLINAELNKIFFPFFVPFMSGLYLYWLFTIKTFDFFFLSQNMNYLVYIHFKKKKTFYFSRFNRLCLEAYLVLRKHAHLLINLLTMMLSCGIPELQSLDDISYVRKTLAVEETEEEAARYFNAQLQSAHDGQWSTKVDWVFHFVKNLSK